MKLRWSERSVNDLIAIQGYIAQDNPQTAKNGSQNLGNVPEVPLIQHWLVASYPNLIKMTYAKYFWATIVSSIAFVTTAYWY